MSPIVTLRLDDDAISEYICDVPGCGAIATSRDFVRGVGLALWCEKHKAKKEKE